MALTDYFPANRLDSPATTEDITHLQERLGMPLPEDLVELWRTSATFNGHLLTASGDEGPYLRLIHPANVAAPASPQEPVVMAHGEDWDFGLLPATHRWVDIDREDGEILSDLASSLIGFLDALRAEHAAETEALG